VGGDDLLSGTSSATAWQTHTKFNATTFTNGDTVLLKVGSTFTGGFTIAQAITLSTYGTGASPSYATIDNSADGFTPLSVAAGLTGVTIRNIKVIGKATNATKNGLGFTGACTNHLVALASTILHPGLAT
jgi:hypothetical protein